MNCEILIVGGGLSGLMLANHLHAEGRDVLVVEARARLGGRIFGYQHNGADYDLGPAWYWPGQPRIAALVAQLGLQPFLQYTSGDLCFEDEKGHVQRGNGFASMDGSYRLPGGLARLISGLSATLPPNRLLLSTPVTALIHSKGSNIARTDSGSDITTRRVVLALPPRVATTLSYTPALPGSALSAMRAIPTWMAGQAKALALYDRPFWREAGLSGDVMSRHGPLAEIHDASPEKGGPFALFGFVGWPAPHRCDTSALQQAITDQLARIFGPEAANPLEILIKDWSQDGCTATPLDQQPLYAHPHYGLPRSLTGLWSDRLILSGTETAPQFGGYLEGALEAAERSAAQLTRDLADERV